MTEDDFRRLALALPETEERSHQGHPDFRVGGKVFASLSAGRAMVRISAAEQAALVADAPTVWEPAAGAWGRAGCTMIRLAAVRVPAVRRALALAWRLRAPAKLAARHPDVGAP